MQSLHVFEVDAGQARELLSADALLKGTTQQLSPAERAQLERRRVAARGLVSYQLSEDGRTIVAPLSGRLYRVDVAGLLGGRTVEQSVKALPPTGVLDPQLSPDGKTISYVKGGDLHVLDLAGGKERRLTTGGSDRVTHGLAEFVAQEEMGRFDGDWWSPDGKQIAYEEADTRGVETFTLGDPAHPESPFQTVPYPRAGKANAKVRLGIVPVTGNAKTTWVKWDAEKYPYLTQVKWPRKGPLTVYVMDREQQHALLLAVDPKTGATRTLLEEQDPAWINLQQYGQTRREPLPLWLPDGSAFFWITERNGAPEAEIARAGRPTPRELGPAGSASWSGSSAYDAAERALYYQASPESPDLVVMRVRDGGNPERVVGQPGERVQVSGMHRRGRPHPARVDRDPQLAPGLVGVRPRRPVHRADPGHACHAAPSARAGVPEARPAGLLVLRAASARCPAGAEAAHHRLRVRRAARQPCRVQRSRAPDRAVARRPGLPRREVRQPRHAACGAAEWERAIAADFAGGDPGGPGDRRSRLLAQAGAGDGPLARGHHRLVASAATWPRWRC